MAKKCFLSGKIHGAVITCAKLEYHGSLSIDVTLMKSAGIQPFEQVDVYNIDNGERLTTYAIEGSKGEICLNGAAAHKGTVGQRIIIATYMWSDENEALRKPKVVMTDKDNNIESIIDYAESLPDPTAQ